MLGADPQRAERTKATATESDRIVGDREVAGGAEERVDLRRLEGRATGAHVDRPVGGIVLSSAGALTLREHGVRCDGQCEHRPEHRPEHDAAGPDAFAGHHSAGCLVWCGVAFW